MRLHPPFEVRDYVDLYASENHAANVGRLFRPGGDALLPNWKYLPVGYPRAFGHGGALRHPGDSSERPAPGRRCPGVRPHPRRLDFEAEVGFVIGVGSPPGSPVAVDAFTDHVFGVFLVNDWSARDIQAWESRPLGPFLAKSFATSISPWVVPLEALAHTRSAHQPQDPEPLPYLTGPGNTGFDLALEIRLNGQVLSRPPFATMYWTPAQMLAHLTVNGASTRTGDFYASGDGRAARTGSSAAACWN